MRAVLQRVERGAVRVEGEEIGRIGQGLVILVGVREGDGPDDADWLAAKVANLCIFADDEYALTAPSSRWAGAPW